MCFLWELVTLLYVYIVDLDFVFVQRIIMHQYLPKVPSQGLRTLIPIARAPSVSWLQDHVVVAPKRAYLGSLGSTMTAACSNCVR